MYSIHSFFYFHLSITKWSEGGKIDNMQRRKCAPIRGSTYAHMHTQKYKKLYPRTALPCYISSSLLYESEQVRINIERERERSRRNNNNAKNMYIHIDDNVICDVCDVDKDSLAVCE